MKVCGVFVKMSISQLRTAMFSLLSKRVGGSMNGEATAQADMALNLI